MVISLDKIRQAAREVALANGAKTAILFGSYARGTATAHSDVDLIFIEETSQPFLQRLGRYIDPLVDRLGTSAEALVYTPGEFELMKSRSFISRALKEGLVLYES